MRCAHFPVLSSLMTYHWVRKYSNTTVPPVEKELLTLPEHLSSFLVFVEVRVVRSLVFCVVFCSPLFDLFLLTIVLSVLCFDLCGICPSSIPDYFYPFGIFMLFLGIYIFSTFLLSVL